MSAIDFRTSLVRKPDPKGDRVVITLDGKVSHPVPSRVGHD
jgi:cyanate lyase